MTEGERDALPRRGAGLLEHRRPLPDAARTVVTVAFELTPQGRVAGDIVKLSDTGATPQAADHGLRGRAPRHHPLPGRGLPAAAPTSTASGARSKMTFDPTRGVDPMIRPLPATPAAPPTAASRGPP